MAKQKNQSNLPFTEQLMRIAGEAGAKAALETVARLTDSMAAITAKDAYKKTERRLYALPVLRGKVDYDRGRLSEYESGLGPGMGPTPEGNRSKDIVRFSKSGSRLSGAEAVEALAVDLEKQIATDEYEIKLLEDALSSIENDPYYVVVHNRYILQEDDVDIAEKIPCDPSTVRKNRGRLVRVLAVRLYGSAAV